MGTINKTTKSLWRKKMTKVLKGKLNVNKRVLATITIGFRREVALWFRK